MSSITDFNPGLHPGPIGPAVRAAAVVPADNADLPFVARRLYVGAAGDVAVIMRDQPNGPPVVFKAVTVGFLDVWVRQVFATGTTAGNLVAVS